LYEIQKGDNLLAIAYRYSVPLEILIELNQIANPRALQIGQVLVIPPDDAAVLALQPTATSTPMPLRVVNLAFHRTPVGSAWCMGEVENERDESLDQVQVQVLLYDTEGQLIDRESAFVATDVVPGQGRAPFAVLIPPAHAARFATYEVHILSAEPIEHWGSRHQSLSITEVAGQAVDGQYVVQGIVHNQGDVGAEDVRVTLTLYGNADAVVGVRQIEADPLAAGEHLEISIALVPSAPVERVGAVAWGMQSPADSP
jgi:LysM repeat protein